MINYDGFGGLEQTTLGTQNSISVNGNSKKKTFSEKLVLRGRWFRRKGKFYKHFGGFLASFGYAKLGLEAQTKKENEWGVGQGYFTKWDTTAWYALSQVYEHAPIFGTSFLLDAATGINEGNYMAVANWATGTIQNVVRFISAWVFKNPLPSISLAGVPIQIYYYRKPIKTNLEKAYTKIDNSIKRKYHEVVDDFKQEREYLFKQMYPDQNHKI